MNAATANGRTSLGFARITALFGAWLVVSPFVLGFTHNAAWIANNVSVGLAIILLALAGMKNGLLKGLLALMGPWLFASAFILGGPKAFMWNNLIFAFLVVITDVASESPYPENFPKGR